MKANTIPNCFDPEHFQIFAVHIFEFVACDLIFDQRRSVLTQFEIIDQPLCNLLDGPVIGCCFRRLLLCYRGTIISPALEPKLKLRQLIYWTLGTAAAEGGTSTVYSLSWMAFANV